jgi:hypothetical protein
MRLTEASMRGFRKGCMAHACGAWRTGRREVWPRALSVVRGVSCVSCARPGSGDKALGAAAAAQDPTCQNASGCAATNYLCKCNDAPHTHAAGRPMSMLPRAVLRDK